MPIKAVQPLTDIAHLWHADELAATDRPAMPTGHADLDAQLPGGGWPVGALVEVLQPQSGQNDWRLLLPVLRQTHGTLALVGPPYAPFAAGLAGLGLDPRRLLCVSVAASAGRLWAAEQTLRCRDVGAVLVWLPQARSDTLRRLQIAAAEHHKLLFAMRPMAAQNEPSPAALRLAAACAAGSDALQLRILKRRGPPLGRALALPARPARLAVLLALRAMCE